MGQQGGQGRNQKTPSNKWKWGHNNPNPVGHWQSNPKRAIHTLQAYLEKQEKIQINIQTSHLKELEKENKESQKWVEGRK